MKKIVLLIVWLLPASRLKNALLRSAGHRIAPTATARANLVWGVDRFVMEPGSSINRGNAIKGMREVRLGAGSSIGRTNLVSAHGAYRRLAEGARLILGERAYITSRHELDCSGSLILGDFAALAGFRSQVLSHSIDLARNAQTAHPVHIGARSFVGARTLLLGGSSLPARSVLAAGSVLTATPREEPGLWAGVPARRKGDISGAWFDRTERGTRDLYLPEEDRTIPDAI